MFAMQDGSTQFWVYPATKLQARCRPIGIGALQLAFWIFSFCFMMARPTEKENSFR